MSGPPLSGSSPAQAAGSSVAGSSRPQALIRRRQRLTDEPRLSTLVILSRPAPQPAPGDSAVALPTTTAFTGIVRAPEPSGDTPPRHIPLSTSLRALPCVPSGGIVRAWLPEPCPAATGGSGFTIEIGSDFVIGPKEPIYRRRDRAGEALPHSRRSRGVERPIRPRFPGDSQPF
jgi:hypothetical protein